MDVSFTIEPGEVRLDDHVVWTCRTLENESADAQIEETTRRFARLFARAIISMEAYR